jgi:stearoyl-CoA desaturase (delta-9 desaturase)
MVEAFLLFFGSTTMQGSALKWSFEHRIHHAHCDSDKDPYSIKKGFWYAHCMWLFEDAQPLDTRTVADLLRKPLVRFQHRFAVSCMIGSNILTTLFFGYITGDYLGALVITFLLRLFLLHHFTWLINSAAHTWGAKPFSEEQSAVDNFVLSILTFGEGYHNYHHTYANDYRNGIRWYHFDPTKWLIWCLSKLGLASGLRRVSDFAVSKRILIERKERMLEQVREAAFIQRELVEQRVQEMANRLEEELTRLHKLSQRYALYKKERADRATVKALKAEMTGLRKKLKEDLGSWKRFAQAVQRAMPLEAWT